MDLIKKLLSKKSFLFVWFPAGFILLTIYIRYKMYGFVSNDFDDFLFWWAEALRTEGLDFITRQIANYNTPYLFLLWIGGKFIPESFMMIKVIAMISDAIAAIGIFKIVGHFYKKSWQPLFAAALYTLIPTVMYNSSAWGQCDGILGACVIWAVFFCLKDKLNVSWILIGICFSFKMQGIFLAPFLLMVALNRRKTFVSGPLLAAGAAIAMSSPTLFIGDSFIRIISFFFGGLGDMFGARYLSWWLPNLHQWFPNDHYDLFRIIGVCLAFTFAVVLVVYGFRSKRLTDEHLMILAALSLIIIPFLLPQMHGRYYFQGEVMLFALLFTRIRPAANFVSRVAAFSIYQVSAMTTFLVLNQVVLLQMHPLFRGLSIAIMFALFLIARECVQYPKYSSQSGCSPDLLNRTGG